MKNKILTWLALSVIFCLSSFETKAQSVFRISLNISIKTDKNSML